MQFARGGFTGCELVGEFPSRTNCWPDRPSLTTPSHLPPGAGSESKQVGDQFPDLLQRDRPDVRARRLDDAVNADGGRQVRLGDTESGDVNLAQPSSPRGRAGHDSDRVLPELEHIIGGDDDGRPDEPRLAPRRRPEVAADDITRPHR